MALILARPAPRFASETRIFLAFCPEFAQDFTSAKRARNSRPALLTPDAGATTLVAMGTAVGGYGAVSLWLETCGDDLTPQPALDRDIGVDVAIVGAGFTGLWTAYYLARRGLTCGSRSSKRRSRALAHRAATEAGRPRCSLPRRRRSPRPAGREGALAQHAAMRASIDEVIRAAARRASTRASRREARSSLARTGAQLRPAQARRRARPRVGQDRVRAARRGRRPRARQRNERAGRHLHARLRGDPSGASLVRGLARAVRERGVAIYEKTPRASIAPHVGDDRRGTVTADFVVRATEGYTPALEGQRGPSPPSIRSSSPPLPCPRRCGTRSGSRSARRSPTTGTCSSMDSAPRTTASCSAGAGRRITLARASSPEYDRHDRVHRSLRAELVKLFPVLASAPFTHRWGGNLGIAQGLARVRWARRDDGTRLGRRLHRRRRDHHQPRGPHAARPHPWRVHRTHGTAVGGPPLRASGSRSRCAGSASTRASPR